MCASAKWEGWCLSVLETLEHGEYVKGSFEETCHKNPFTLDMINTTETNSVIYKEETTLCSLCDKKWPKYMILNNTNVYNSHMRTHHTNNIKDINVGETFQYLVDYFKIQFNETLKSAFPPTKGNWENIAPENASFALIAMVKSHLAGIQQNLIKKNPNCSSEFHSPYYRNHLKLQHGKLVKNRTENESFLFVQDTLKNYYNIDLTVAEWSDVVKKPL
ncbi:unnamed protein product [Cunninghamella blakesleeana]